MTDEQLPDDGDVNDRIDSEAGPSEDQTRWWYQPLGRLRQYGRWLVLLSVGLISAGLVSVVTIDLGPALRVRAEQLFASRIDRSVSIGRLSTYILPGRFLVEDLVIGGRTEGDRPFFVANRLVLTTAWLPLLDGEFLVDSVDLDGWRMLVEQFEEGDHTFPVFFRQPENLEPVNESDAGETEIAKPVDEAATTEDSENRRFVTTVQYLRAHNGEFVYEDYGAPWSVVAPNIDFTMTKSAGYGGQVSFHGGTVQIADFEPMTTSMRATYELDGGFVDLKRVDVQMDGFEGVVDGAIDFLNWPESIYRVTSSSINLPIMKDVFFAGYDFVTTGEAAFTGEWHVFDGGRELTGTFTSGDATLAGLKFPDLDGDLVWTRDRFEITRARSGFYDGQLDFTYSMQPLGAELPAVSSFSPHIESANLEGLTAELEIGGIRPSGSVSGSLYLEWPLGQFAKRQGRTSLLVAPPDNVFLQDRRQPPTAKRDGWGYAGVPFEPEGEPWQFPMGANLEVIFGPDNIAISPSWIATPLTAVDFYGETAWGKRSSIPFEVKSADWQESDRLLASMMTAFGRPTGEMTVGGYGTMVGEMRDDFFSPVVEALFDGDDVTAWNVDWGHGEGSLVVQRGILDVTDGIFSDSNASVRVNGLFAIGRVADGVEEMDASFELDGIPAQHVRDAFSIEGYPIDGPLYGDIRLYGEYRRPFGFGRLRIGGGVAYGESFDQTEAGLRFEGEGVWLDGLTILKGDGELTGAMYVRWDGTYSVNADARDFDLVTSQLFDRLGAPVVGYVDFSVSGAGSFENPRYQIRGGMTDLAIQGASVGQVTSRLDVQNGLMAVELEVASPTLAVSGSGRVELSDELQSELRFRVTNTTLDPFIRTLQPGLPEETSLVTSGTIQVEGSLANVEQLTIDATAEQLDLRLFDYGVSNSGPVSFALNDNVIHVTQMELEGEGTALKLSGDIVLSDEQLSLDVNGDASLDILQGFFPNVRGSGTMSMVTELSGSFAAPTLIGEARVTDGRLRHFSLPHSLDEVNGTVVFEPGSVQLDGLAAKLGGGSVHFGGQIGLQGYQVGVLDVTATGENMALRVEGIRSDVDADLTLRGSMGSPTLGGVVNVRDAIWLDLFQTNGGLISLSGGQETPVVSVEEDALPLNYDLQISAPSSLRVSDNRAQIVASADLTLRGTYSQPILVGNAEIDRGQIYFEGNRYRVIRGNVGFSNPIEIEPFFEIEAETDIRVPGQTYRVTLGLTGTLDRLASPTLESDPPLQQFEIIGLLLGDVRDPQQAEIRTLRARESSQQELLQAAGARLLTNPLSSGVGSVMQRSFGVDTFEITPSLDDPAAQQSTQLIPTARVLIGKRISDRAHVTFSRAVSGNNQDLIVILEYDASDRLSWVLSQNEDRTYALDFRVRHAF